jgi:8-oxo-dGTP pyrophosphatase MutT (NUDIX family)
MDVGILKRCLTDHRPADGTESGYVDRMLDLLDGAGDPFDRAQLQPGHFTASAFLLSPDEEAILLILHGKLGLWLQPGGHIDGADADIFAAARREAQEETGVERLSVLPGFPELLDVDIHRIPGNPKKGEAAHFHFDVRVLLKADTLEFAAGSDALDARWVRLKDVEEVATDESVRRAVRKLRAHTP